MIAINANNLSKSYGTYNIFNKISFNINVGDKVGIVGPNGAGKSTLLNILSSEIELSEGSFFVNKNLSLGYLKQADLISEDLTIKETVTKVFSDIIEIEKRLEELQKEIDNISEDKDNKALLNKKISLQEQLLEEFKNKGGYRYKSDISSVLNNLNFIDDRLDDKVSSLSGGQKARLSIACLLLRNPDILLLDEPTNHLDIDTLSWFENFLSNYKGTLIIISHDRYFLDKTVNRIFEINNREIYIYEGNYSFYSKEKLSRIKSEEKKFNLWQKERKRQEVMIARFKQHKTEKLAKRAASREKKLAREEDAIKKPHPTTSFNMEFNSSYKSGNDVIFTEHLSKNFGYGNHKTTVFKNVNLDIKRGRKICIIGKNGVGKSSLLKIIIGDLIPSSGRIRLGKNVKIGYYDQSQQNLNENLTPFEEIHNAYPKFTHGQVRANLGKFSFDERLCYTSIKALSGGQRARLCLLKLMLSGANLLILDEPTNHLDIESREIIETAIMDFEGTSIIVSHDRYLLSIIPDEILELTKEGINRYLGKYDYYLFKKENIQNLSNILDKTCQKTDKIKSGCNYVSTEMDDSTRKSQLSSAELRQLQKEQERQERKLKKELQALEEEIEELENKIFETETYMCEPEIISDAQKLYELNDELIYMKDQLNEKYKKWLQYENI